MLRDGHFQRPGSIFGRIWLICLCNERAGRFLLVEKYFAVNRHVEVAPLSGFYLNVDSVVGAEDLAERLSVRPVACMGMTSRTSLDLM